jgi:hypothetical protein
MSLLYIVRLFLPSCTGVVFQCSRCSKAPTQPEEKSDPSVPVQTNDPKDNTTNDPKDDTTNNNPLNPLNQQKSPIIKVINAYNLDQLQARYQQPTYTNCILYLRGDCPHGRHGLDEVDGDICTKLHPKKCFPWIKAGNNETHGCTKGRDCPYFHPQLCRNSVRYRRCTNPNCTYTHLRFTRRYNRQHHVNNPKEDHPQHRQSHMPNPPSAPNHNPHTLQPREHIPPPWLG